MRRLKETYDLMPIRSKVHYSGLGQETAQIKCVYQSRLHHRLVVIDKAYGGRMDSLNAGLNISQYPYIASVGPWTVLERDALVKIMKPFMDALPGEEVVACSGRVDLMAPRNTNHTDLTYNSTRPTDSTLYVMQTIEYVRAFLIGGVGLVRYNINVLLFTSEVFGVFKKNRVMEVGGYKRDDQVAHMELVMRLQKHMKRTRERGRIIYIPDPICRVEVPGTWRQLCRQRIGWHMQLASSLWAQRSMIFNPAYGWMGMVSILVFYSDRIVGPFDGTGSDFAVHLRHRATVGGYQPMHHSRSAADALWFTVVRRYGNVRSMVFTQSVYVQRSDASVIVSLFGDVLVQTAEQYIPYVWHFAGYGIEEGKGEGDQEWIGVNYRQSW